MNTREISEKRTKLAQFQYAAANIMHALGDERGYVLQNEADESRDMAFRLWEAKSDFSDLG